MLSLSLLVFAVLVAVVVGHCLRLLVSGVRDDGDPMVHVTNLFSGAAFLFVLYLVGYYGPSILFSLIV